MVVGGWLCCVRLLELSWLSQELAWKDQWHLNSINNSAFGHLVGPRGNLKQEPEIRHHLIQSSRQSSVYCNLIIGKCLTKGSEPTSMWKVHPEVQWDMWVGDNLGVSYLGDGDGIRTWEVLLEPHWVGWSPGVSRHLHRYDACGEKSIRLPSHVLDDHWELITAAHLRVQCRRSWRS